MSHPTPNLFRPMEPTKSHESPAITKDPHPSEDLVPIIAPLQVTARVGGVPFKRWMIPRTYASTLLAILEMHMGGEQQATDVNPIIVCI